MNPENKLDIALFLAGIAFMLIVLGIAMKWF